MSRKLVCLFVAGVMLALAGSASAETVKGKVLIEYWFGNGVNNNLASLTGNADFPNNPADAEYLDALHPAVLYLIKQVADAAHQYGKWAGVCGEVAGDPLAAPVLIGLGVDELSMNPAEIPLVKAILRQVDLASAKQLAEKALECENAAAVRGLAREFLDAISK